MAKLTRERALQERRALKQQKKDEKKQAALDAKAADPTLSVDIIDAETPAPES